MCAHAQTAKKDWFVCCVRVSKVPYLNCLRFTLFRFFLRLKLNISSSSYLHNYLKIKVLVPFSRVSWFHYQKHFVVWKINKQIKYKQQQWNLNQHTKFLLDIGHRRSKLRQLIFKQWSMHSIHQVVKFRIFGVWDTCKTKIQQEKKSPKITWKKANLFSSLKNVV